VDFRVNGFRFVAQTRYRSFNDRSRYDRNYDNRRSNDVYRRYNNNAYRNYDYRYRDRSFWEEHRDKLTTAGGAGAGALLGAIIGGKKGAIIGALAGGGGAAIYTYGIRDKNHRHRH
jgi:hypothetical protein